MTRINTNVASLVAMSDLGKSNSQLEVSLQRLSSGLRINTAKDDPSGLIISELLRSEMTSIRTAIDNTNRASNVIATAEGALNEVSTLLNDIRDLVVEAASTGALTAEEIEANQLQIDSAVESITRIANSTTFGGTQLLNGNMDFQLQNQATVSDSGNMEVSDAKVYMAQFGSATNVDMTYSVSTVAAAASVAMVNHADGDGMVLEVTGNKGSVTLNIADASGALALTDSIVAAVNGSTDMTGVAATDGGTTTNFVSSEVGSEQFVNVRVVSLNDDGPVSISTDGVAVAGATSGRDAGVDVAGTINGQTFVGRGDVATINTTTLQAELTFARTSAGVAQYAAAGNGATGVIRIAGGGATFQLGQDINSNGQVRLGIQSMTASNLGGGTAPGVLQSIVTGGANSLLQENFSEASQIIDKAILDVATLRGRLGAVQLNTLDTNVNSLQVTLENLTASESTIRDTDFAAETASLTRNQILVSAGTSVLATANATPQSVLALLQG